MIASTQAQLDAREIISVVLACGGSVPDYQATESALIEKVCEIVERSE